MSTLGIMKERIASELRRDDLSAASEFRVLSAVSDIHDAILTAIDAHDHETFYFSQKRAELAFNTVALQHVYTSADAPAIARIVKLDYGFVLIGGQPMRLRPSDAAAIEASTLGSVSLGQPSNYAYFAESLMIEPIPSDIFALRFAGLLKIAAPAADDEASNRWMLDGEALIRARAKWELYTNVIKDPGMADRMAIAEARALTTLRDKTESKLSTEETMVEPWDPFN